MKKISFLSSTAETDSQLLSNPDRGWRLEAYVNVSGLDSDGNLYDEGDASFNVWNNIKKLNALEAAEGFTSSNVRLVQTYFYLDGYNTSPVIDQNGLDRIQSVFDKAEELGVKLIVRFAYQVK